MLLTLSLVASTGLGCPRPSPSAGDLDSDQSPDAGQTWLARVQQGLAEREYAASRNDAGLQAPNRRHNWRAYFDGDGIRLLDRTADGSPELLRLSLAGWGRGDALAPVRSGVVSSNGARVEIRRPGLVEWYLNSPDGLEQGFTVDTRPGGEGPLTLELRVERARARLSAGRILLATPSGRRLEYGKLAVVDARGAPVDSSLTVPDPTRVHLTVADAMANYPLTIDPLLTSRPAGEIQSNQADAQLGTSVAGAGDVNGDGYDDVIVGAPYYDAGEEDEGAAFVFLGGPGGLEGSDPVSSATRIQGDQADAELGSEVAGAGDVNGDGYDDVLIGAQRFDAGAPDAGAAFIFLGSAAGIADGSPATADTRIESSQERAFLAASLASAGDVDGDGYDDVIIGAPGYDLIEPGRRIFESGAAYVFLGDASGIPNGTPETASTRIESRIGVALLGSEVAGAGDVDGDGYDDVLVGVRSASRRQVLVYLGSASGIPHGSANDADTVIRDYGNRGGGIGQALSGAGDVNGDGYDDVVVGAPLRNNGAKRSGAAFLYLGGPSGIEDRDFEDAATRIVSSQKLAYFGDRVAAAGDLNGDGYADIAIGASRYDSPERDSGAAFIYLGSGNGIPDGTPDTAALRLEGGQKGSGFGYDLTGAGDVDGDGYDDLVAGARSYEAGESDEGAAFVYLGGPVPLAGGGPAESAARITSDQSRARLGWSVSGAGDVNGDGYDDWIVGADLYDAGETNEGAAFLFLGSAEGGLSNGYPETAAARFESDQPWAGMGRSVAGAGDVDGDGYDDVIVGADLYDAGEIDEGAAFLFLGGASGISGGGPESADARLESDQPGARMGWSVSGAGDVDDDGYDDVIVGAVLYDSGEEDEGAAFVFSGGASALSDANPSLAATRLESDQVGAEFGASVGWAGDVNGDGYDDVIVGAPRYDSGTADEGAAFVFHGGADGVPDATPATSATVLESDQKGALLGWSVSTAGDVEGDGYDDVIAGAPSFDDGQTDEGAAFVFSGGAGGVADGTPATAAARIVSNQARANLGSSVAGAGDLDADGFDDVIVGAERYDAAAQDEGAAFVFRGRPRGLRNGRPANATARITSGQAGAALGGSVAGAGDVDGDGFDDVIVGAHAYDSVRTDEGAAFVFLANRPDRTAIVREITVPEEAATIQEAVDRARPGGVIRVVRRPYEENVVIDGVDGLKLLGKDHPLIDGGGGVALSIRNSRNVTIAGFELSNSPTARDVPIVEIRDSQNVVLKTSQVGPGAGAGVSVIDSPLTSLSKLEVRGTGGSCIELLASGGGAGPTGGRIDETALTRCGTDGIRIDSDGNEITANRVREAGQDGVSLAGRQNEIVGNDVRRSGGCDLHDESEGGTNTLRRNLFRVVCEAP